MLLIRVLSVLLWNETPTINKLHLSPLNRQYTILEPIAPLEITYFDNRLLSIIDTPDQLSALGGGSELISDGSSSHHP